jgi:hypothetical protein
MYWLGIIALLVIVFLFFMNQKEGLESRTLSLVEFNDKYQADIVALPTWLFALGVENNKYNTYSNLQLYAETMIKYWMEHLHPHLPRKYYVIICPFDGFGNNGDVSKELTYKNVTKESISDLKGRDGYIAVSYETNEYPVFHSKKTIFAVCKNINDKTTILLPDFHFIGEHGYKKTLKEIDQNRVEFRFKKNECIWRGDLSNGTIHNFLVQKDKDSNPRQYFKKLYEEGRFKRVNFEINKTSIPEQITYKYILDIDGCSSTWSATIWKLYSGSVLLKTKSKWKQWYYDDFKEWIHYVPIENDFSDLNDKIQWCIHNESECEQIVENAKSFVLQKLNWEQVKQDTIDTVKKYLEES